MIGLYKNPSGLTSRIKFEPIELHNKVSNYEQGGGQRHSCSWLIFYSKTLPITYWLLSEVEKKKVQILIGCIFWRWDCARVRFLAGMNCGLNYLKGKGLKNIGKVVFAATIYQIWLQRNRRINNSRILLEDCIVENIRDVVRFRVCLVGEVEK